MREFHAGFQRPHTPEALHLLVPGFRLRAQFDLLNVNVFFGRPELGQELVIGHLGHGPRFGAHLAGVEVIVDGVGVAHLVVLVLRVVANLPEQAVRGHGAAVVHPYVALPGGPRTAAAARERDGQSHVSKRPPFSPAAAQHASHAKSCRTTSNETRLAIINETHAQQNKL